MPILVVHLTPRVYNLFTSKEKLLFLFHKCKKTLCLQTLYSYKQTKKNLWYSASYNVTDHYFDLFWYILFCVNINVGVTWPHLTLQCPHDWPSCFVGVCLGVHPSAGGTETLEALPAHRPSGPRVQPGARGPHRAPDTRLHPAGLRLKKRPDVEADACTLVLEPAVVPLAWRPAVFPQRNHPSGGHTGRRGAIHSPHTQHLPEHVRLHSVMRVSQTLDSCG